MPDPVEQYLKELRRIRSSGAAAEEISYYAAISNLLNTLGRDLKPSVSCVMSIANQGAGLPDGALFTEDQLQSGAPEEWQPGQVPARGVIEIKGTGDDAWLVAKGEQVTKYWQKYRQVLVTNYRDFVFVGQDEDGKPKRLESFRIAKDEKSFWSAVSTPQKTAKQIGSRFTDFIRRVMLHSAPLQDPHDVAWFLASYAREARARLSSLELEPLVAIRTALEDSLGLKFAGGKGESFFRSTLVQTLFYGIFSAWILWCKQQRDAQRRSKFEWRNAAWFLRIPMVRELFEQISAPTKVGSLGLVDILDLAESVLNRVDKDSFFVVFADHNAVQYFYEPFLQAFDPDLRKQLGVWYTPPEVVRYMVTRVDTILKEKLDIPDGLADPRVYVLDPACGTGSYLLEVLRKIAETLNERNGGALLANELKRAAIDRVFGFELLPAPFVVAHLQIGLLLENLGAHLSEKERAGIYLTNSLTGWDTKGPQQKLVFAELENEREEADRVKRDKPILVIIGNPPYNAFAGVSPVEEEGLVEPYKEGLIAKWRVKKFNLDELYIRFFRIAERRIVEHTGRGLICYISNFSYLGNSSFVVIRERFLREFDEIWIDCLNGSSRETGKLTPDGKPDPSVFSTKQNPEGIRVGTAIGLFVRKSAEPKEAVVRYRDFWGVKKREELLSSLGKRRFAETYQTLNPIEQNTYSFRHREAPAYYHSWPSVVELCDAFFNGPIERRGNALICFDSERSRLNVLRKYLDPSVPNDQVAKLSPHLMKSSGEFKAEAARAHILQRKIKYDQSKIVRYPFKPFDVRLAYLDAEIQPLFSRPSPELLAISKIPQNAFLITRDTADKLPEGPPLYYSSLVCDYHCISGEARHIPFLIERKLGKNDHAPGQRTLSGLQASQGPLSQANLSLNTREYLKSLGLDLDDPTCLRMIWLHVLAVAYAPTYLKENANGIRVGWPRVPLPKSRTLLRVSSRLGADLADLLDTERAVVGVTHGTIRRPLKTIATIERVGGGSLSLDNGDLRVTAGWGYGRDVTMPGSGTMKERNYSEEECVHFEHDSKLSEVLDLLGRTTCNVYLNEVAFWTNVPRNVWEYTLGGTQVLKKWLSYREYEVVSRDMTPQEVQDFTVTARRITSILLLTTELDANYHAVKENCYDWRHNNGAGVKDGISVQGKLASDRSRGAGVQI